MISAPRRLVWHAPAPAPQLPSAFEEEPVPFSEYLSEDGVVDTRSTPLPPLPLPLPPPSPVPPPFPPLAHLHAEAHTPPVASKCIIE